MIRLHMVSMYARGFHTSFLNTAWNQLMNRGVIKIQSQSGQYWDTMYNLMVAYLANTEK